MGEYGECEPFKSANKSLRPDFDFISCWIVGSLKFEGETL